MLGPVHNEEDKVWGLKILNQSVPKTKKIGWGLDGGGLTTQMVCDNCLFSAIFSCTVLSAKNSCKLQEAAANNMYHKSPLLSPF